MQQLAVGLIDVNTTSFIIDHDYVSRLVDADSLRTHQLAAPDLVYIFSLWGEDAHPLVVVIGHEEVAVCRHRNAGWPLELTGLVPSRAETEQTVSVAGKDLAPWENTRFKSESETVVFVASYKYGSGQGAIS